MAFHLNNIGLGLELLLLMTMITMGSSALISVEESATLLLQVKAPLIDPAGSLKSWTQERASTLCEDWHGITCDNTSSVIVDINLSYQNLSGSLSPAVGSLSSLQALNMSNNMLAGEVPSEITGCESLRSLDLSNNNFSGELPVGLSQLAHLETLSLWTNSFVGPIPEDIVLCSQLKHLDLGGSYLEGEIPHAIGNLSNLVYLTLAGNELTGGIPSSLGRLKKLEWIYIGFNQLTGSIPSQLGEISTLQHLDLVHNNLSGELPNSLTNLTNLEFLFLYDNQLVGGIPPSIANLNKLLSLDLSSNRMSGVIPGGLSSLGQLQILNLFQNEFSGEIPHALAEMKSLQVLALWMNKLTGEVPSRLGSLNNLTLLDLSTNELTGPIPEHLCASNALHNLILFSNSMSGPIPQTLARCQSLQRIRLEGNQFSGSIPEALASLPRVYYLDLSSNNFTGTLDSFAWNMPSLQVLHLQGNHLTGSIPPSLQNSIKMETLDFSQNALTGHIPLELGSLAKLNKLYLNGNALSGTIQNAAGFLMCKKLADINLSQNQLGGSIPTNLVTLTSLSSLDLSHNDFSGEIPPQLGDMDSLVFINLSFNHLSGKVPQSGAFIQINASSIQGNPGLCGGSFGPCGMLDIPAASGHGALTGGSIKARVTAVLLLLGLMICVVGIGHVIWKIKHGQKTNAGGRMQKGKAWGEWRLTLFQAAGPSVEEILGSMQEENVVEKARSPSFALYKGSSKVGGQFAAMEIMASSFESQLKTRSDHLRDVLGTLSKSRHPNIVNVYGICCGMESSIMVLELVEGCSLRSLLQYGHHRSVDFSIESRLRVAIDIGEAIMHLHNSCSPPIRHGSISSDNIILDNEFKARLLPPSSYTSSALVIMEARSAEKEADQVDEFAEDVRAFGEMLLELVSSGVELPGVGPPAVQQEVDVKAHGGATATTHAVYKGGEQLLLQAPIMMITSGAVQQQQAPATDINNYSEDHLLQLQVGVGEWSAAVALQRVGQELKVQGGEAAALPQALRVLQGIWRRRHSRRGRSDVQAQQLLQVLVK